MELRRVKGVGVGISCRRSGGRRAASNLHYTTCCFFCYKSIPKLEEEEVEEETTCSRFFKLLAKHIQLAPPPPGGDDGEGGELGKGHLHVCDACTKMMGSFIALYGRLEAAEMKVNKELGKVKKVMESADKMRKKIPPPVSRVGAEEVEGEERVEGRSGRELTNFRKTVIQKCTENLERKCPQVLMNTSKKRGSKKGPNSPPVTVKPGNGGGRRGSSLLLEERDHHHHHHHNAISEPVLPKPEPSMEEEEEDLGSDHECSSIKIEVDEDELEQEHGDPCPSPPTTSSPIPISENCIPMDEEEECSESDDDGAPIAQTTAEIPSNENVGGKVILQPEPVSNEEEAEEEKKEESGGGEESTSNYSSGASGNRSSKNLSKRVNNNTPRKSSGTTNKRVRRSFFDYTETDDDDDEDDDDQVESANDSQFIPSSSPSSASSNDDSSDSDADSDTQENEGRRQYSLRSSEYSLRRLKSRKGKHFSKIMESKKELRDLQGQRRPRSTGIPPSGMALGQFPVLTCPANNCIARFLHPQALDNHSKHHGHFSCPFCDFSVDHALKLALHESEEHATATAAQANKTTTKNKNTKMYSCARCADDEFTPTSISSHYLRHHLQLHLDLPIVTGICPVCQFEAKRLGLRKANTYNYAGILQHIETVHSVLEPGKKTYKCDHCPVYFASSRKLEWHQAKKHPTLFKLSCRDCSAEFRSRKLLLEHRREAHPTALLICSHCGIGYETQGELERHELLQHISPLIPCPTPNCRVRVKTQALLQVHLQTKHNNPDENPPAAAPKPPVICDQCGIEFPDQARLSKHQLTHSGPSSWTHICPVCRKRCRDAWALKTHQRSHTGEKPHMCQYCGRDFACRTNWLNHCRKEHGDVFVYEPKKQARRQFPSTRKGLPMRRVYADADEDHPPGPKSKE